MKAKKSVSYSDISRTTLTVDVWEEHPSDELVVTIMETENGNPGRRPAATMLLDADDALDLGQWLVAWAKEQVK